MLPRRALLVAAALLAPLGASSSSSSSSPSLVVSVGPAGNYSVSLDGEVWYASPQGSVPVVCVAGNASVPLSLLGGGPTPLAPGGSDPHFGPFAGVQLSYALPSSPGVASVVYTFKSYPAFPSAAVLVSSFPNGLETEGCGPGNTAASVAFPAFDTQLGRAPSLGVLTWKSEALASTVAAVGLGNLGSTNDLALGPVLTFEGPGTAGRSLMWSSLSSHKILVQNTAAGPSNGAITSLWSAERSDQIACLSALCAADQVASGNYISQRVEGYGIVSPSSSLATAVVGGVTYDLVPLSFFWSSSSADNFVGWSNASSCPDASYSEIGPNGFIFAASSSTPPPAGTIPLIAVKKVYNASHTDWAAVASPAGLAWASANGYETEYTIGLVWAAEPSPSTYSLPGQGGGSSPHTGAPVAGASSASGSLIYSIGLSAAIPSVPAGWSYSVLLSASGGGVTSGVYAWGEAIRGYSGTIRSPSVTLQRIGYYTDDGAYYYVWEAFDIPERPFAAQDGLLAVVKTLKDQGVPVAYLQLDDWPYVGPFYFGNVKAVVNWTASTSPRLFPDGYGPFSDALGLALQLYVPFFDDSFFSPYNMTESTAFRGTKLVTPDDSYAFFSDFFDLGSNMTNGRFSTFEIDFLMSNFAGSASMFEDVGAADRWYAGMADAALERGVTLQYCLPSATDMLQSLGLPAVVQARASPDYVNLVDNPLDVGGSSLLMGAVQIAPSKDTLWTFSPQPPTSSDTVHSNYTTQPHVRLDVALALLSLGPVGISDGLNQTDVGLISQTFMSPTDGTLLRPSRPLSWVDSVVFNASFAPGTGGGAAPGGAQDVRSTHAALPLSRGGGGASGPFVNSHVVLAWRTTQAVALAPTDLYPPPAAGAVLALREHVFAPQGAAQQAGCADGQPAAPSCVSLVPTATAAVVVPATGSDISNVTVWSVFEPLPNGAYFLGELGKIVPASPMRFDYVLVGGEGSASHAGAAGVFPAEMEGAAAGGLATVPPGRAGIVVGVRGSPSQTLTLTAVAPDGTASVVAVTLPESGFADVGL